MFEVSISDLERLTTRQAKAKLQPASELSEEEIKELAQAAKNEVGQSVEATMPKALFHAVCDVVNQVSRSRTQKAVLSVIDRNKSAHRLLEFVCTKYSKQNGLDFDFEQFNQSRMYRVLIGMILSAILGKHQYNTRNVVGGLYFNDYIVDEHLEVPEDKKRHRTYGAGAIRKTYSLSEQMANAIAKVAKDRGVSASFLIESVMEQDEEISQAVSHPSHIRD